MAGEPTDPLDELLDVRGRDVLDVGCGGGWLVRRLAAAGARAVGVDPSGEALDRAREAPPAGVEVRYEQRAAEALAFADASFDVAIFFNSLHHVPVEAMDAALSEAARVLRPDGVLYVQEPVAGGSAFELLRPVDDETAVRRAAQGALERAAASTLVRLAHRDLTLTVRHADFPTLRARTVHVDPARADAFRAHEPQLRASFERLGRPLADGGVAFEQPFHIDLMRPRRQRESPLSIGS